MCWKQGINGAMEVKGMRHQQGEDQGNKPFPVAMLILSGDETPWGENKRPLGLATFCVGDLQGKAAGCEFAGWAISHWKRSVSHGESKTPVLHLRQVWGHTFEQGLLCHHRNRAHGPVALPWLKVLLFATTLPCVPQGSGRLSLLCSGRPRLPTKPAVTDKHFWSVICILGRLKCPFSFPWLSGQVIRLWWYELLPQGLQLHLQGHMVIKQTAQDFAGTPSNFMRRIQTNSPQKDKTLPVFACSLSLVCLVTVLNPESLLCRCSFFMSPPFFCPLHPPTIQFLFLFHLVSQPGAIPSAVTTQTHCSSLLLGEFYEDSTFYSLCGSAPSGVILDTGLQEKWGKGWISSVLEG